MTWFFAVVGFLFLCRSENSQHGIAVPNPGIGLDSSRQRGNEWKKKERRAIEGTKPAKLLSLCLFEQLLIFSLMQPALAITSLLTQPWRLFTSNAISPWRFPAPKIPPSYVSKQTTRDTAKRSWWRGRFPIAGSMSWNRSPSNDHTHYQVQGCFWACKFERQPRTPSMSRNQRIIKKQKQIEIEVRYQVLTWFTSATETWSWSSIHSCISTNFAGLHSDGWPNRVS